MCSSKGKQSGQCDLIVSSNSAQIRQVAGHNIVDIEDSKLLVEVKSNATGKDFYDFNEKSKLVKSMGKNNPLCGMFCYRTKLLKNNLLKRFGYKYLSDIDGHEWDILNGDRLIEY